MSHGASLYIYLVLSMVKEAILLSLNISFLSFLFRDGSDAEITDNHIITRHQFERKETSYIDGLA